VENCICAKPGSGSVLRECSFFLCGRRACVFFARSGAGLTDASVSETLNRQSERILDDYGNSILRLAYSYLHNQSDAEEILQDTLIQFLKAAPVFENETHKKAWLLHVAGNLSKNRIDFNRIRDTDELNEELISQEQEDLTFVWEAVKSLPVRYRETIHLFYYEGCSTAQIAEILQQKESTVRSHLDRGREKLKDILKEAYDFE